jgi:hypothetical protein
VDLSSFAIESVPEAIKPYVREGSIAEPFGERFALITCIEVLEHMQPEDADRAIANIAAYNDEVLFSSTPFDYKEPTHVNVRMPVSGLSGLPRWSNGARSGLALLG